MNRLTRCSGIAKAYTRYPAGKNYDLNLVARRTGPLKALVSEIQCHFDVDVRAIPVATGE